MKGSDTRRSSTGMLMLACAVGVWSAAAGPLLAAESAVAGILVLRNGNVVRGDVLRTANHYRVKLPRGELQIGAEQVEMFCHSLDEAYERRRSTRTGSTADSHVELARWCLRHDLLEYAARELLEARAIDPHHRPAARLERQLQQALTIESRKSKASVTSVQSAAALAAHAEVVDKVPPSARAAFVRQIQPMLVHSCAMGGCHGTSTNGSFQLDRLAIDGAGHPVVTLRNLASIVGRVNLRSPHQSPLLIRAAKRHGEATGRQSQELLPHQQEKLRAWVEQLAIADRFTDRVIEDADRTSVRRDGIKQAGFTARDPFDPEAFNRQTAAEQSTARQQEATPREAE